MNKNTILENKIPSKFLGYFFAVISIFIWGITFVCTKHLLTYFSAFEILFIRFVLAYIFLWILFPHRLKLSTSENILVALAGLTGVTLYQFTENLALDFTTASNVSIIVGICPIFTALTSQIFLKEKHLSFNFCLGFCLAFVGVVLVSFNGKINFNLSPKGDILALISAICWGFYSLFLTMINKKGYNTILITRKIFFYAILFMIPLMIWGIFSENPKSTAYVELSASLNTERFSSILNWILLCFLGILASGFCFVAWNKACNILGTVKISTGLYLIPVITIFFAAIFLNEKITLMGTIGSALTIIGLFVSSKK
jgi:drug/metabolite transporter (DMT)-like permease